MSRHPKFTDESESKKELSQPLLAGRFNNYTSDSETEMKNTSTYQNVEEKDQYEPTSDTEMLFPPMLTRRTARPRELLISSVEKWLFNINEVVIQPTLKSDENILKAFNQGNVESFVTPSIFLGKRIKPSQFRLVHRNNVPELVAFTSDPMRLKWYSYGTTAEIAIVEKTDQTFGAYGRHVVNVKPGKYIKAWLGNEPVIYAPGAHVIRHTNFSLAKNSEVSQSDYYIRHGNIHIVRVPQGKLAKVWIGGVPHLLEANEEAYVFNNPLFRLQTAYPQQANAADPDKLFIDADAELITHGSLKRLMPHTGNVVITYDGGNLEIIAPQQDNKPTLIDSPTHTVSGMMSVSTQTLTFPSEEQKNKRRDDGNALDYVTHEVFRTRDSSEIGVKLLVVYQIKDPEKVLLKLGDPKAITPHIEDLVVADMTAVMQGYTSQDFMSTEQTRILPLEKPSKDHNVPSAPEFIKELQDLVKKQLASDFAEYGIHLERVNMEAPKILKMSDQSKKSAEVHARVALLQQESKIAENEALRAASKKNIEVEASNKNKISEEQAELEAAKLRAQAVEIETMAEANKIRTLAEAENKALRLRAQLYRDNPQFFQLELCRLQAVAVGGIKITAVSLDQAVNVVRLGKDNMFFSAIQPQLGQLNEVKSEEDSKPDLQSSFS
ncbi:SPFH domain-containing protein [Coxiella burnetii]|nr:SPFH domain-containing protein [Coxiella burnetii]OYK80263.1 hypothetical protein CbuD7E6568_05730 [Coxiella burnetii]